MTPRNRVASTRRTKPSGPAGAHALLLEALGNGRRLATVVPRALAAVREEPLADAGKFPGALVRGLMNVPATFWARHAALYDEYRAAVRAAAAARRALPHEERMLFWSPLE